MPHTPQPPPLIRDPNLHVVFSVTLMAVLGVASVTPAFPRITEALDITPQSVGLLISVFTVPGVVLTPALGILADRIGRKAVLAPSLFVFALAGAACGFARDFELLMALRLLQGVGASALGALNVTIMGDLYGGTRRTTALGYNASVLSVGTAVYPAVGGGLATLAWYAPFFLPVLAVPVGLVVLLVLQNPEPRFRRSLREYLTNAARIMGGREVLVMFCGSVVTFILIYGAFLSYLPFVLETSFGASPLWIGIAMSSTSVTTAVAAANLGRLARAFGERRLIKVGFVLYVVSLAGIPFARSLWVLVALIMLFGVGNGINIPSILAILTASAPAEYRAVFMSVNSTLFRLGQTLGPLVTGLAFTVMGLSGAFFVGAALGAAVLLVLVTALRGEPSALSSQPSASAGRASSR